MKHEAPTEREIADLFATAFDRLPEPDPRRLVAIEEQLLEQPRLHGRKKIVWWWLVGALVAGAASALWWSVNYDSGKDQETPPALTLPSLAPPSADQPAQPDRPAGAESAPAREPAQKQGPMIYQRER